MQSLFRRPRSRPPKPRPHFAHLGKKRGAFRAGPIRPRPQMCIRDRPTAEPTETPAPADPFAAAPGYLAQNAARYADYAALHPEFTPQQAVTYVNIGLDREFYTQVETVADPDSLLVLCNKYHQLPDGYEPADLTQISAAPVSYTHLDVYKRQA